MSPFIEPPTDWVSREDFSQMEGRAEVAEAERDSLSADLTKVSRAYEDARAAIISTDGQMARLLNERDDLKTRTMVAIATLYLILAGPR